MTLAQKVADACRKRAASCGVAGWDDIAAELNAIADVVEAADRCRDHVDVAAGLIADAQRFDTALAKLAKAVGVEGE